MKFIRLFWGDLNIFGGKYKNQIIKAKTQNLNETVFVWGKENFFFLKELGFECELVSDYAYDYSISNNHTFFSYKNLNHKLKGIEIALNKFDEIIFLDWDCRFIKEIDDNFYKLIKEGNKLQIPLYVYPKNCFQFLIKENDVMADFFTKLKTQIIKYSYEWQDNYVIPNTGFIYCRNKNTIKKLIKISTEKNLECIPDEFSVFLLNQSLTLNEYILKLEPTVIGRKTHDHTQWNEEEKNFFEYKNKLKEKVVYITHD